MVPLVEATAPITLAQRPAAQLAGPFAAIGFVGGGLVGSLAPDDAITTAFALVTAFTASILGAALTHHRRTTGELPGSRIFWASLLAGTLNGALLMIWAVFPLGCLAGALVGCFFAIPFVPALLLVARWGGEVGMARPDSLVDRARRRGPIAAMALSIAASTLFTFLGQWKRSGLTLAHVSGLVAVGVLALVVLFDAHDVSRARRLARDRTAPPIEDDFGVGDDVVIDGPLPLVPYRTPAATLRVCGGDPATAAPLLRALLVRHALALIVATLVCGMQAIR